MFPTLQTEVMERFTAVKEHFRASRRFNGRNAQMARGIVFVEIYAVWEYTLDAAVKTAGTEVSSQAHTYDKLTPSMLAAWCGK